MNSAATVLVIVLLISGMLAMGTATTVSELAARLRSPTALLTTLGVNLVVIPAAAIGAISALTDHSAPAVALVLVAASPGGGTGALLSFHARGDVAHAVTLQVLLAAGSLLAMPLWIAAYTATSSAGDLRVATLVLSLLGYQLLPLVLGLGLRSARPSWASSVHSHSRRIADLALAVLIGVLVVTSGSQIASISPRTFVGIIALAAFTMAVGAAVTGQPPVRRSSAMTTLVRNLSLALMAARFAPSPDLTALVILTYGLAMYVLALAFVRVARRTDDAER